MLVRVTYHQKAITTATNASPTATRNAGGQRQEYVIAIGEQTWP